MIKALWFRRWLPVAAGSLLTIALWAFVFFPYRRQATADMSQARATERQLQAKLALLQQVPTKKKELDSLLHYLHDFRSGLFRTDQVDELMRTLERRARDADITFWSLDPSVPILLSLEDSPDSVAALQLAVLPLHFECYGDFVAVGKFLEAEERRAEFATWESLSVTPKDRTGDVRARGEATLFLLPAGNFEEKSS